MNIFFLSCVKATELIEKRFHFKLTATERMRLKAHKMMCEACTRYEKHSVLLEKCIQSYHKKLPNGKDLEELKKQIALKLNENKL